MVGVRETRRNWVVPPCEQNGTSPFSSSTWSASRGQNNALWGSTTHRDFPPKKAADRNGRYTYKDKDPRNNVSESERFGPWTSTTKSTHAAGLDGYMFLGIPARFRSTHLERPKPMTANTTHRADFKGLTTSQSPSVRDYWLRADEYAARGTRPNEVPTFKSDPGIRTSSHAAHTPLQEAYPQLYGPKQYPRTDFVLSSRPPLPDGRLEDKTTFKESFGVAPASTPKPHAGPSEVPAGYMPLKKKLGSGKRQIHGCLPREDILKATRPLSSPMFSHKTEHKDQYVPKTVRHTEWYGSQPQDFEQEGEGRFYTVGGYR